MVKTQRPIVRIFAMLMLVVIFLGMFPVNSYAKGTKTIYLETLISEDSMTYVTNPIVDNFSGNKKYEYMYTQIGQYLAKLCGDGTDNGLTLSKSNANYCYSLSDNLQFDSSEVANATKWIATGDSATMGDFFTRSEGFFDDSMNKEAEKSKTTPLVGDEFGKSTSYLYSKDHRYLEAGIFQFPSNIKGADATTKENDYAINSASTLTASLNQLLVLMNNGQKFADVPELINKSISIRPVLRNNNIGIMLPSSSGNKDGYIVVYAPNDKDSSGGADASSLAAARDAIYNGINTSNTFSSADQFFTNTKLPKADDKGNLLMYVFKIVGSVSGYSGSETITLSTKSSSSAGTINVDTNSMTSLVYAVPKGYKTTENGLLVFPDNSGKEMPIADKDTAYLTIHMLAQSANNMYKQYGLSISTIDHSNDVGLIEKAIIGFFNGLVNGLLSFLGLSSTNELVYNGGLRGSSLYNYGVMSDGWWQVVIRYHIIFQAIAWFIIIVGFLKTLISLNMSTINPRVRENVYESIKKFIVVGFGLVIIIPVAQFLMQMNSSIVGIFSSQVDLDTIGGYIPSGLAGIIIIFINAAIQIYVNFVYIMRSIIIALLLISAPFFVATIAVSKDGRSSLFVSWAKELLANIFLQSVHAFCLAFLWSLMQYGTGLENIVISFSIIPITEMFRAIIFAGAGGATEALAKQAQTKAQNAAVGFASGVGNAVAGGIAGGLTRGDKSQEEADKAGSGGSGGGGRADTSGFSALNSAASAKIDSLRGLGDEAKAQGKTGLATAAKVGAAALGGSKAAGRALGAIGGAFAGVVSAEMTGNAAGYSAAGQSLGSAVGAGMVGAGGAAQQAYERSHNQDKFAGQDGVSDEELSDLHGGTQSASELSGTSQTVGSDVLRDAAARGGPGAQIAQKMQESLNGSGAQRQSANAWLASKGITGVSEDKASGTVSFNKGIATVPGREIKQHGSQIITKMTTTGHVTASPGSTKANPSADEQYSMQQFQSLISTNANVERFASQTGISSAMAQGGGSGEFQGGSFQVSDGKVMIRREGATASADGRSYITQPSSTAYNPWAQQGASGAPTGSAPQSQQTDVGTEDSGMLN